MTTKALAAVVAAILGIIVLCALGGAALFGGGSTGCSLPVPAGPAISAPAGGWPQVGAYSPDQVAMAATIVSVGAQMGVPVRGWVIGVATAIQESSLSGGGVFWDSSAGPDSTGFACDGDGGDGQPGGDSVPLPADYTLPPDTPPAVATAIFWALGQLGTPYHLDGDCTAAHSGDPAHQCDCSSLVQQAYRAAGITIPRSTRDQIYAGTAVTDPGQIQPGDLLFIPGSNGTPDHPGHVGMAMGDGLLVQAPHTGDVVKITKISQWANQISIIRRVT